MKPLLIAADFSHHNGTLDHAKIAGAGIEIAMLKASQGTAFVDPRFVENRDSFAAVGVAVIPYHFLTIGDPIAQAQHFIDAAELAAGSCAAWDWETSRQDASDAPEAAAVDKFILRLEATLARDALRYHGEWPPHGVISGLMLKKPWWLPRYGEDTGDWWGDPDPACLFHQYTSKAILDGVQGKCDRSSVYAQSVADVLQWIKDGTLPQGVANV